MKKPLVFVLLLLMLIAFVGLVVLRNLGDDADPAGQLARVFSSAAAPTSSAGADAAAQATDGGATEPTPAGLDATAGDSADRKLLARPLRVVGLGWELLAAGVLGNGGLEPGKKSAFAEAGLDVHFAVAPRMVDVERALAHGGEATKGADVAIVPLPSWVASYERMRALATEAFFVVGWSRGREGLAGTAEQTLANLPAKDPIKLRGLPGSSATFFALFALDLAGASPERVRLLPPAEATSATAPFAAVELTGGKLDAEGDARKMLLTTADATGLIPYVAVAPRGFLTSNHEVLTTFCKTWLEATEKLRADVPAAARALASQKGAPDTVVLLERLGWIELAGLRDNAQAAAMSGRSAVTIDELFHHTWRIWRGAGQLTTPGPDAAPVAVQVITTLVRNTADVSGLGDVAPGGKRRPKPARTTILITHTLFGTVDEQTLVREVGFVARVFSRSPLRISVKGRRSRGQGVIDAAVARFNIAPDRLSRGRAVRGKASAVIEVLAAE